MKQRALTLKQFMLRQEVLRLYRDIFRTIRRVPRDGQQELQEWARRDFRTNSHHTDETTIKMLLQYGRRSLNELKNSLELSGN
uniref:LYR motif-containing protein 2 n=1 Tax=Phlebotomus kandelakii TaxID=1109342 RepID=A0A6B2EIK5_9DIPT